MTEASLPCVPRASRWRTRLSRALGNRRVSAEGSIPSPATHAAQMQTSSHATEESSTVDIPLQYYNKQGTGHRIQDNQTEGNVPEFARTVSEPVLKERLTVAMSVRSFRSSASQVLPIVKKKVHGLFHVWDNRLAMKMFGSRNGIQREEERRKNLKHWVIHPCSKFRYVRTFVSPSSHQ